MPTGRGGSRAGAGRKPGSPNKLTKAAKATLSELASAYTEQALAVLAEIMLRGQSESARITAANSILDRGHGKVPNAPAIPDADDEAPNAVAFDVRPAAGDVRVTKPE